MLCFKLIRTVFTLIYFLPVAFSRVVRVQGQLVGCLAKEQSSIVDVYSQGLYTHVVQVEGRCSLFVCFSFWHAMCYK